MSRYTGRKRRYISGGFYKRPWTKRRAMGFRRRKSAYGQATTALKLIRRLRKDEEIKENYGASINVQTPIGGAWSPAITCNGISQGNTAAQRIGQKIVMKSFMLRGRVYEDATETGLNAVRIVLVYDRRPIRTAVATGAQIFTADNLNGLIQSANKQYAGRFQILVDKVIQFLGPKMNETAAGVFTKINSERQIKIFKKLNHKTFYNGQGAIQTNFDKGQLLLMMSARGNTVECDIVANIKVRYADL